MVKGQNAEIYVSIWGRTSWQAEQQRRSGMNVAAPSRRVVAEGRGGITRPGTAWRPSLLACYACINEGAEAERPEVKS